MFLGVFGDVDPSEGASVGVIPSLLAPVSPDLGALIQGHAARYPSALARLANPSSVIRRCVFLANPR